MVAGRPSLTFPGTADLALKGDVIGEFGERLAAWLVALSVWTEWLPVSTDLVPVLYDRSPRLSDDRRSNYSAGG